MTVVRDGPYAGATSEGPEYETVYALGTSCGIYDLGAVIAADQLCDLLGIDTISVGVTISFAMECYERGLLDAEDTGGIDLRFGNAEAMLQLIHDAAYPARLRGAHRPRQPRPGGGDRAAGRRRSPCTARAWRSAATTRAAPRAWPWSTAAARAAAATTPAATRSRPS